MAQYISYNSHTHESHNIKKMVCLASPLINFQRKNHERGHEQSNTCLRKYVSAARQYRVLLTSFDLPGYRLHQVSMRTYSNGNMPVSSIDADEQTRVMGIAMNGGDGPHSYAENSAYQRGYFEAAKEVLKEEIVAKLDVKQTSSAFRITDLGCSTGPNTYLAAETIVEAVEQRFKSQGLHSPTPEIEVLFNDTTLNDFNTLLRCLPPERRYYATAAPGSFYSRLFPKASIHIVYSACTICWLSRIPKEVTDETSPAWNKGSIHYDNGARKKVFEAYEAQFAKDMEVFLQKRAEEIVNGGLMALLVAAAPDIMSDSVTTLATEFQVLGSCLVDMAKQGIISEEKVDTFNLPLYYTRPKELKELILRNGSFSIERMEILNNKKEHVTMPNVERRTLFLRACFEGLFGQHFGYNIVDELFDRYAKKVVVSSFYLKPENQKTLMLFVLLKRNDDK
uniref:S-adenosylmethionine-dependent methyltransferase At5g38100 n=1 Tax=Kalanchoe fedtschenkoi TaxID=63787 RepID=A0A7N0UAT4_KALFE